MAGVWECSHGTVHTREMEETSACMACFIEAVKKLAQSRNGSPEQDEIVLREIVEFCDETLEELGVEEGADEEEEEDDG